MEKKTSRLKRLQRRFIVCGLTPIMLLFFIFSVVPILCMKTTKIANGNRTKLMEVDVALFILSNFLNKKKLNVAHLRLALNLIL